MKNFNGSAHIERGSDEQYIIVLIYVSRYVKQRVFMLPFTFQLIVSICTLSAYNLPQSTAYCFHLIYHVPYSDMAALGTCIDSCYIICAF